MTTPQKQLSYVRIIYESLLPELADYPVNNIPRIYPPEHFRRRIPADTNITIHPIAGEHDSLWHCLLFLLYPPYRNANWTQKKQFVTGIIQELSGHSSSGEYPELELLAAMIKITIIIVNTIDQHIITPDTDSRVTIILYQTDTVIFHPIFLNNEEILKDSSIFAIPSLK